MIRLFFLHWLNKESSDLCGSLPEKPPLQERFFWGSFETDPRCEQSNRNLRKEKSKTCLRHVSTECTRKGSSWELSKYAMLPPSSSSVLPGQLSGVLAVEGKKENIGWWGALQIGSTCRDLDPSREHLQQSKIADVVDVPLIRVLIRPIIHHVIFLSLTFTVLCGRATCQILSMHCHKWEWVCVWSHF